MCAGRLACIRPHIVTLLTSLLVDINAGRCRRRRRPRHRCQFPPTDLENADENVALHFIRPRRPDPRVPAPASGPPRPGPRAPAHASRLFAPRTPRPGPRVKAPASRPPRHGPRVTAVASRPPGSGRRAPAAQSIHFNTHGTFTFFFSSEIPLRFNKIAKLQIIHHLSVIFGRVSTSFPRPVNSIFRGKREQMKKKTNKQ